QLWATHRIPGKLCQLHAAHDPGHLPTTHRRSHQPLASRIPGHVRIHPHRLDRHPGRSPLLPTHGRTRRPKPHPNTHLRRRPVHPVNHPCSTRNHFRHRTHAPHLWARPTRRRHGFGHLLDRHPVQTHFRSHRSRRPRPVRIRQRRRCQPAADDPLGH